MALLNNALDPNSLFMPWQRPAGQPVSRGSLISFSYPRSLSQERYQVHDAQPMLIITDVNQRAGYIRGVNLHYLTVPDVKGFLTQNARNPSFSYASVVKPNLALAGAFRMYYFKGMFNKRRLDTDFLMQLLNAVRSFTPSELERVKNELRQQIQKRLQVKTAELNNYTEWQNKQKLQTQQPTQQFQSQQPQIPNKQLQQPITPVEPLEPMGTEQIR